MKRLIVKTGGVLVVLAALAFLTFLPTTSAMKEGPSGTDWQSGGPRLSLRLPPPPRIHCGGRLHPSRSTRSQSDRQSRPTPQRYKAFELNEAALTDLLANAPMEFTEAAQDPRNEITLPTPDGAVARFRFVESPIMEPKLAAQIP